ncbi:hypothetical protein BRADI_4g04473v3, partial [Brachypodium distachyon]
QKLDLHCASLSFASGLTLALRRSIPGDSLPPFRQRSPAAAPCSSASNPNSSAPDPTPAGRRPDLLFTSSTIKGSEKRLEEASSSSCKFHKRFFSEEGS